MVTTSHPQSKFDAYPAQLDDLAIEFGTEGLAPVAVLIINAEHAEFCWQRRMVERKIGAVPELRRCGRAARTGRDPGLFPRPFLCLDLHYG